MSPKKNRQISCVILIASLFMGIGYATVNSVIINISGKTTSKEVTGIYITQVNYKESTLSKIVTNASETATANYAKIGNGYVKIMFIDEM